MKIFDLSPKIGPTTAVFPGDCSFKRHVAMSFQAGETMELSSMETTLHIGAHADAPCHYDAQGESVDQLDPAVFVGRCEVVHANWAGVVEEGSGYRVGLEALEGFTPQTSRVLVATKSFADPHRWQDDFAGFAPDLIDHGRALAFGLLAWTRRLWTPRVPRTCPPTKRWLAITCTTSKGWC